MGEKSKQKSLAARRRKRSVSFALTRHRHSPGIWLLLLISGVFVVGGLYLVRGRESGNPTENVLAYEEDRDGFWEQVKASTGLWVENAGQPILDNQPIARFPTKRTKFDFPRSPLPNQQVLGSHVALDGSERWIEVDLSDQRLYAWEGEHLAFDFFISSGKDGYETVQGDFRVWRKVKYQAYRGGSRRRRDYYYLPNVPFSLFFYKGYAIHGAYWHNDFGIARRSRGCVNVRPEEAEQLWYWAGPAMSEGQNALNATEDNPGVKVVVHE